MKKRFGFTLAEVLITLGIIGVVAAMTMPTLMANHQKQQTLVQLKKAYSEISQAIKLAEPQMGLMETWDFSDFETPAERTAYFADNILFQNLKILKDCRPSSEECWTPPVSLDGIAVNNYRNNLDKTISFITTSGYSVYYWIHATGTGGWLLIDINSNKKPNMLGKDVFAFEMNWSNGSSKIGIYPPGLLAKSTTPREDIINGLNGIYTQNYNCKKGAGEEYAGVTCSSLIMMDGWQITKDYPW